MPLPVRCNQIPDSPQLLLVVIIVTNDPGNYTLMPFVTGDSTWRWNDLVNLDQVRYPVSVQSRRMMWGKTMHFSDRWTLHNIAWLVAIIITQIKRPRDLIAQSLDMNHLNSCFLFSISSGTFVESVSVYELQLDIHCWYSRGVESMILASNECAVVQLRSGIPFRSSSSSAVHRRRPRSS